MAAGVAIKDLNSTDTRATLQAAKKTEAKRRLQSPARSGFMGGLGGKRAQTVMLGAALSGAPGNFDHLPTPAAHTYSMTDQDQSDETDTDDSTPTTAGEEYQKAFQSRRISHQIGGAVGLDVGHRSGSEDTSELEQIQQNTAAQEAEALQNNQQGIDTRSSAAKRAARHAIQKSGLDEGVKAVQDAVQKELGSLGMNLFGDGVIGADAIGEDFYVSQGVVFVQRNLQAARTILSPVPPSVDEMTSVQDIPVQAVEKGLDFFIPRFALYSMAGMAGILGFILQWFIISAATIVLTGLVLLISSAYNLWENPLTSIWTLFRAQAGL
ncbi:MAG: hypothetical protein AAB776_01525 [Patescibacteria group bacterium]